MAVDPLVEVGFEGDQYMVPKSVLAAGMAKQYIEDQLAEQAERAAQKKAKVQQSVESEFSSIKAKLGKLDELEAEQSNQAQVIASYEAANKALKAQVEALESSGADAGSASAEARQVSYDLANAATVAAGALADLTQAQKEYDRRVEQVEAEYARVTEAQTKQINDALAAGQTRERLAQERVNALLDRVAQLEARALDAEAKANQALRDAEASQSLNKNDITRDQVMAMVHAEWLAQQDGITDAVVENIRDEFPNGLGAQRVDKERTRQLRSDAANFNDAARGGIG